MGQQKKIHKERNNLKKQNVKNKKSSKILNKNNKGY